MKKYFEYFPYKLQNWVISFHGFLALDFLSKKKLCNSLLSGNRKNIKNQKKNFVKLIDLIFHEFFWLTVLWLHSIIYLFFFSPLGMTNAEVLHQVDHGYRMQCPQGCPRALYDIMLECWHKDPVKRPTFETLQWKLEDFFTMSDSEYRDATAYWWYMTTTKNYYTLLHYELIMEKNV